MFNIAIEITEELGSTPIFLDVKESHNNVNIKESAKCPVKEGSLMVDIEAIHSVITKNLNYYEPNCLETSVPLWTSPYERPLIMHHNEQDGVTIGRVKEVNYITENTRSGTPALLFKCNVSDPAGIEGVRNGTLATVSIGATVYDARCSICGHNIAQLGECEHDKGRRYGDNDDLCYWIIKKIEPKEVSYVIVPSDKFAHNVNIYEPKSTKEVKESIGEVEEDMAMKDLFYDELSKQIALIEAQKVNEEESKVSAAEEPTEKDLEKAKVSEESNTDEKEQEEAKQEKEESADNTKTEEVTKDSAEEDKATTENEEEVTDEKKDKKIEKDEEREQLKQVIKELKGKISELEDQVKKLEKENSNERKLKESAETELLKLRKAHKLNLIEKINTLREGLELKAEDSETLINCREDVLEAKLTSLTEVSESFTKQVASMPKIQSTSLIDESKDNTIVTNLQENAKGDINLELSNKFNSFFKKK